ncbi:hypothetical protein SAMN04487848_2113 [Microbacterium sp. ru370.1]|uniref:hypothetical protein n=1 Tax=unclassified Microbacterium TaxID=2609290 RepID=UPI00088B976E|nr:MULTISPECIES: hypothetical protein [unclassified Microbacterium]SDO78715.1 hypothetical protein SAMN04487848_2113 [Microbacterium sp. ru370.1]SIT89250.1 hypothetical protein SAMN05880579_2107 [Microbacterium sp. RU1D]
MSTSETPETPALTRRQLRELRQTGATPIIPPQPEGEQSPDAATPASAEVIDAVPAAPADEAAAEDAPAGTADEAATDDVPAGADGAEQLAETPAVESSDDESAALDDVETDDAASTASGETAAAPAPAEQPAAQALRPAVFDSPFTDTGAEFGVSGLTRRQARAQEKIRTAAVPIISSDLEPGQPRQSAASAPAAGAPVSPAIFRPAAADENATAVPEEAPAPSVVNPALGSDLLDGQTPDISLPASFDQLISRNTGATGTVSTPNALILSQTPTGVPLVGPINGTGEIMITGTFELPEGLGSVGHAPGTTDGRDADAVLLDGELPPASSPTPIAASAAISTVKQPGEIIRPPAPEKGSKLLVGLIITTGALALAVAVTLVLAFTTGVFR